MFFHVVVELDKDIVRPIHHNISTTVSEALTNPKIRKKMNKSIWLHEEGFNPYNYGLKTGDLPNLVEFRAKLREL